MKNEWFVSVVQAAQNIVDEGELEVEVDEDGNRKEDNEEEEEEKKEDDKKEDSEKKDEKKEKTYTKKKMTPYERICKFVVGRIPTETLNDEFYEFFKNGQIAASDLVKKAFMSFSSIGLSECGSLFLQAVISDPRFEKINHVDSLGKSTLIWALHLPQFGIEVI
jgi:hypothetical protein